MELDASHLLKGHTYDVHQVDRRRIRSFDNNMYADGDITLNEKSSLSLSYVLQEEHPKVSSTALTCSMERPTRAALIPRALRGYTT